jgi:hypothetical protein
MAAMLSGTSLDSTPHYSQIKKKLCGPLEGIMNSRKNSKQTNNSQFGE